MFTYEYPRPALTTDCVVFGFSDTFDILKVLLIKRAHNPFEGHWALPGGFVDMDEDLPTVALRELEEETGLTGVEPTQFGAFGGVNRDPRGRVVSVAYYTMTVMSACKTQAASDARELAWFDYRSLPPLAFDHEAILASAVARLRSDVLNSSLLWQALPKPFSHQIAANAFSTVFDKGVNERELSILLYRLPCFEKVTKEQYLFHPEVWKKIVWDESDNRKFVNL
jgi:8-oxo-dGTP diphosphatase